VRVNLAGQDKAYRCVYQLEDENGESHSNKSYPYENPTSSQVPHAH
jgi:hypothetical protein